MESDGIQLLDAEDELDGNYGDDASLEAAQDEHETEATQQLSSNEVAAAPQRVIKFLQPDGSIWEYEDPFVNI